jgi:subtilase family serine protease
VLLVFGTAAAGSGRRQLLHRHVPVVARTLAAVDVLPPSNLLSLTIGLPLRDETGLTNLLEQLYDPSSPLFRHYLSPEEFADRFGPTKADYQALIGFAESNGLTVLGKHSNRLVLDVRGSVSDIERTFGTRLKVYAHPRENRRFFAPEIEPSVPLNVALLDVSGLDSYVVPEPMSLRSLAARAAAVANAGSAPGGSYRGNDFRAAYLPGVGLTGNGQIVGLLEFDGYYTSDISTYETQAGLPNVPLQNVLLNNFKGNPGANNAEVALDIEVAIALAPGLSSVMIYEGNSANSLLSRMANDNRAKQLSSSWTFGINATTENIFRQFATQGQSMFQASGDDGAYTGLVPTPADNPNLTVVGGTTLSTSGPSSGWTTETTWNWFHTGMGSNASSGGVSTSYAIPSYQKGLDMGSNQGSSTSRNIPDVAMTADNVWVVWNNGSQGPFGGTSAATPLWAAFMALVNQQAAANGQPSVGFVNPAIYSIGKGTNYAACFHDITTGDNINPSVNPTNFRAVAGYDLCTGWGTPAGQALINALAGGTNLPPTFKSNPFVASSANAGQPYSASVSNQVDASPSDRLSFGKFSGPAWLTMAADGSLGGTPANTDAGTNRFVVGVTNAAGMFNTATMYLKVNTGPVFNTRNFTEPSLNIGQACSGSIASMVTDPTPGATLTFTKQSGPAWLTLSAAGALSGAPAQTDAGTNVFTVTVTDADGLSDTATMYIDVNAAPAFTANPITAPAVSVGQVYTGSLTNQARDPNPGATLTFSKLSGPSWLSVAPDGTLFGTPAPGDVGTNSFTVTVSDSGGLASSALMNIPVMAAPGLTVHIAASANTLILTWVGGTPPFQVQVSTNFAANQWQNVGGAVSNHTVNVFPATFTAAYRIEASGF